ncbi:MAG: hypothetical protein Ta2C_10700 [Candidatus Endomicrobiellum trichonymphae]|uniref:hypothetical protein n=1 Tax=Endomicrobium trichonymphae TaxID=1408204 RepID=UPI0027D388CD|nr:MAG: hypothetical protein Ta2C_10700 [Candidatus Endomicrobium trichonymphae]
MPKQKMTLEELETYYKEQKKAIKQRCADELAAEKKRLRKLDTHIKIIIGSFIEASYKKNQKTVIFDALLKSETINDKDKKLLESWIKENTIRQDENSTSSNANEAAK